MELHSLLLANGTQIFSGENAKIAIQKVTLTEKVNTAQLLQCGSVFSACLEVQLLCEEEAVPICQGDEIRLLGHTDGEITQLGVFYAQTPVRTGKGIYRLTAYDSVQKLDKDLSLWLEGLPQWPYSLQNFAQMVCRECGVELTGTIPNGDFSVEKFSGQEITGRRLISWAAEACGRFCRANREGLLEFGWYTPSAMSVASGTEAYYYQGSFQKEQYAVKPIDQVQLRKDSTDVGTVYPQDYAGENVYVVEGNPLLTAKDGQSLLGIAQSLYTQLSPVVYTPCKLTVPSDLDIQPGQIIQVEGCTVYVMERQHSGLKDTLSCSGTYDRQSVAAANTVSLQALSGKVLHLRRDVDGILVENQNAAGAASKMELDIAGIRTQVVRQTEETAAVKSQLSTVQQDSEKMELRLSQIEQTGAGQVTTSTGYRFDKDGLFISKTGEAMENRLDNTGMYVRRSGEVILQANNEGVTATDVAVRNFLLVGDHARFENYGDARTACFYIGGENGIQIKLP